MRLSDALLAELRQEAAVCRKVLERIPADKFDWKPHEKSMTMGRLAGHLGEMFAWTGPAINSDGIDFSKMEYKPSQPATTAELVENFDKAVNEAAEVLLNADDAAYGDMWTLRDGEKVFITMPKAAVIRGLIMNHIIHHRGQLSVYLRLLDIPVPPIYGPSADEGI